MTWTTPLTRTAAALALGLSMAAAPGVAVMAQDTGSETTAPSYDDRTLERFVTAAMEVSAVREAYNARLQTATSEADAETLVQEANTAMLDAVEGVDGMDVDTYVEIGEAAQQDPQLAARISEIVGSRNSDG